MTLLLLGNRAAVAGDQVSDAMKRLGFLSGSWSCLIHGKNVPKGDVDHVSYEFSPDWSWMIERSTVRENGHDYWTTQLWGYDAGRKQLVAYQFTPNGVATKTVQGWIGGEFRSTRDDNGATVTVKPVSQNAFDWVIESADHSSVVTESCTR